MAGLDESLRDVLGGKAAKKLDEAFGLRTTGDLLRHYPRRYAQRGELTDLAALRDGEHVTVFAQVARVSSRRMRQRRGQLLEVTVTDGQARLALTFFNKVQMFERQLTPGRHGMFAGRVSTFKGQRQLAHPEFKLLGADDAALAAEYAAELIPVYPASKDAVHLGHREVRPGPARHPGRRRRPAARAAARRARPDRARRRAARHPPARGRWPRPTGPGTG